MDVKTLFEKFLDKNCKITKTGSKRENSMVHVNYSSTGDMSLYDWPATDKLPEQTSVMVYGNGFDILRTSPVIGIVDETENSIRFETEGGFYLLELK